jgi:hypothetical protein
MPAEGEDEEMAQLLGQMGGGGAGGLPPGGEQVSICWSLYEAWCAADSVTLLVLCKCQDMVGVLGLWCVHSPAPAVCCIASDVFVGCSDHRWPGTPVSAGMLLPCSRRRSSIVQTATASCGTDQGWLL